MKTLLNIAVLLSLLSLSQAQTVYTKYSQPWNTTYGGTCANGEAVDTIAFSGTTQTLLAETFQKNGWIIAQWNETDISPDGSWFTLTGVGQTTGLHYEIVMSSTFTGKLSPAKVQTGIYVQDWTANTGADYQHGNGGHSYQFHEDYKYTITNGVWTYSDVHFFWLCK